MVPPFPPKRNWYNLEYFKEYNKECECDFENSDIIKIFWLLYELIPRDKIRFTYLMYHFLATQFHNLCSVAYVLGWLRLCGFKKMSLHNEGITTI